MISDKDLEVDIVKAWSDLDKSLIAEGLISGLDIVTLILYLTMYLTIKG